MGMQVCKHESWRSIINEPGPKHLERATLFIPRRGDTGKMPNALPFGIEESMDAVSIEIVFDVDPTIFREEGG